MTRIWVGNTLAIIMLLASVGAGVSAPHPSSQGDNFERPNDARWELIRGDLSFNQTQGPRGDGLTWMVLTEGETGGDGPSRVRANASHVENNQTYWTTEGDAYRLSITLQRDPNHVPSGTSGNNTTGDDGDSGDNTTSPAGNQTSTGPINVTLDANVTQGILPLDVGFTMGSDDPAAGNLSWDFYPFTGSNATASGLGLPNATSHTYGSAGEFTARIEVSNGTHSGNATIIIVVEEEEAPTSTATGLPEGAIGITFGEQSSSGYFVAAWTDERFILGYPDNAGEFTTKLDIEGWGSVPDSVKRTVDERKRFEVQVEGTSVMVLVGNAVLGTYALPAVPEGTFGVIAAEDTRVNVGEVYWQPLDRSAPAVEIVRPVAGSMYIEDIAVPYGSGGPSFVEGDLTVFADITDTRTGVEWAQLLVNGKVHDTNFDAGIETPLVFRSSNFAPGYHTLTVRSADYAGNMGTDSIEVFVLGPQVTKDPVHTAGSTVRLVTDRVPDL